MEGWVLKSLNHLLVQKKRSINIDPDSNYSLVTITNKGEVKLREKLKGSLIGADKAFIAKSGDFIYSRLAVHTGAFGIVPENLDGALVTSEMPCFEIDKSQIIPEILIAQLKGKDFKWQLKQLTKGIGRIRVKETMILGLHILITSKEKQLELSRKINIFQDKLVEINTELETQQVLLKKLRQRILQEAMEGKLTFEWRTKNGDEESACKLLNRIAQVEKDKKSNQKKLLTSLTDDEKPYLLPEKWVWCRLGNVIEQLTDYHANGSYEILKKNVELHEKPNYAIMLRTTNFHKKSKFNYKYITKEAYDYLDKSKVYPDDVIMNKIADPGSTFYVEDRGQPMSLAMNLFLIRFRKECIISKFAFYYLRANYSYIVSFASGTATPTITKDAVKHLRFVLPPKNEQKEIVARIETLQACCDQLETHINNNKNNAEQLMQAVLKEAFSFSQSNSILHESQKQVTYA